MTIRDTDQVQRGEADEPRTDGGSALSEFTLPSEHSVLHEASRLHDERIRKQKGVEDSDTEPDMDACLADKLSHSFQRRSCGYTDTGR